MSTESIQPTQKNFLDHIVDLKNVILFSVIIWVFFTALSALFIAQIEAILFEPASSVNLTLHFLSPMEALFFSIKLCALAGLTFSMPFITMIIWNYVQSALLMKEKKAIFMFAIASSVLTVAAILYSWFGLIPNSLRFLVDFTPKDTQILLTITEYFNFIFALTLALVVIFQVPTLIFSLIKTGIVSAAQVSSKRKEIYMGIIILTALFGSPDLFSWLLTTVPAIVLFEGSLVVSRIATRNRK